MVSMEGGVRAVFHAHEAVLVLNAFARSLKSSELYALYKRGHRHTENARAFARCRAHTTGELGEVVGRKECLERPLVVARIHERVPLGNAVTERAPALLLVAERHATVHAPGRLGRQQLRRLGRVGRCNLRPVGDALS